MTDNPDFLSQHFSALDQLLRTMGPECGVSEAHGLCCGLVCLGETDPSADRFSALLGLSTPSEAVLETMQGIHALAMRSLRNQELAFDLLLPDEAEDVRIRVEALAEWCAGFLRGFLSAGPPSLDETGNEAVEDISAISNLENDDGDLESQERSLFEIQEYLRVAVQILFDQLNDAKDTAEPQLQ